MDNNNYSSSTKDENFYDDIMLTIDGAMGEGGGQILRSALAFSLYRQVPFRIVNIRSARAKPGLMRQHLAAVNAAAVLCGAEVKGAVLGSQEISFVPKQVKPGEYRFVIGTAGSTTLVLQTVLPALLTASAPSRLILEGGTHNPHAPPFDFLNLALLPLVRRMGPKVFAYLERPGFYPAGGGIVRIEIAPVSRLQPLHLQERGAILEKRAMAWVSHLPEHIAHRELEVIGKALGLRKHDLEARRVTSAKGPGNVVTLTVRSKWVTEVFTGFGERGVRAEAVAERVARAVRRYLEAGVPVGEYLADQLLLFLALAESGSYVTLRPSLHTLTNIEVVQQFVDRCVTREEIGSDRWRIILRQG